MSKLKNDKYYTPVELAKYCVEKTNEIIGKDNITEYIEPSAGAGVFLDFLDKPYLAYDIEPEDDRITKADWLTVNLPYKKGRCIIGNPPFGEHNILSVKFYKKAVLLCDYIAFILPISQLNNNQQLYEFDLVYSTDLGKKNYSGKDVHCCFNIYMKKNNYLNYRPTYKLKDITIKRFNSKQEAITNTDTFDLRICFWGSATGNIIHNKGTYAHEIGIQIHNEHLKDRIINVLENADWRKIYNMTSTPALYHWQIYKYLKEQIPELEYEEDINKKNKRLF